LIDNIPPSIATVDGYEKGEDLALLKQKYAEGVKGGDTDRILVWAGSGVGLMNHVKPARVCLYTASFSDRSHVKVS
jgi:nitronate monooxygenase